jgi:hypothetical protein
MIYLSREPQTGSHKQQQKGMKTAPLTKNITLNRQRNWDRRPISRDLGQRYTPVISGKAPQILMTHTLLDLPIRSRARLLPLLIQAPLPLLPGLEHWPCHPVCQKQGHRMRIRSPMLL